MIYFIKYGDRLGYEELSMLIIIYVSLVVIDYIFRAFAQYKISKSLNTGNSWMSFIPYLNNYYIGKMINNEALGFILTIVVALSVLFDNVIIATIFNVAFIILYNYCIYILLKKLTKNYKIYTILSVVTLGFLGSIFLFVFRNKKILKK